MLRIRRHFNLAAFESGLDRIAGGEHELRLSTKIAAEAVGGIAALYQLIITWSRRFPEQARLRLFVDASSDPDPNLRKFARTSFGLLALYMAKVVYAQDGATKVNRSRALQQADPLVLAMHLGSLTELRRFEKTTLPFICLDSARNYSRPERLYRPTRDRVRTRSEFASLLRESFDAILPESRKKFIDVRLIEDCASLVYEAFQNTHEHAQTDFKGNHLNRSARGLLITSRYVQIDALAKMAEGCSILENYFKGWTPDIEAARHAQFIEISIFDSGSGLAQTWLAKQGRMQTGILEQDLCIDSEYEAVLSCLRKGGTTTGKETRGYGLFRIVGAVKRTGGFIRVRTGRLSLVKAFSNPMQTVDEEDLIFDDAFDGGRPNKPHAWADGTTITAVLPVNRGPVE